MTRRGGGTQAVAIERVTINNGEQILPINSVNFGDLVFKSSGGSYYNGLSFTDDIDYYFSSYGPAPDDVCYMPICDGYLVNEDKQISSGGSSYYLHTIMKSSQKHMGTYNSSVSYTYPIAVRDDIALCSGGSKMSTYKISSDGTITKANDYAGTSATFGSVRAGKLKTGYFITGNTGALLIGSVSASGSVSFGSKYELPSGISISSNGLRNIQIISSSACLVPLNDGIYRVDYSGTSITNVRKCTVNMGSSGLAAPAFFEHFQNGWGIVHTSKSEGSDNSRSLLAIFKFDGAITFTYKHFSPYRMETREYAFSQINDSYAAFVGVGYRGSNGDTNRALNKIIFLKITTDTCAIVGEALSPLGNSASSSSYGSEVYPMGLTMRGINLVLESCGSSVKRKKITNNRLPYGICLGVGTAGAKYPVAVL